MSNQAVSGDARITEDRLAHLPEPVQRYMRWTGVVGKPWIHTAYVRQDGKFRLAADKPWMPMKAEQVYTIDPLAMQGRARFKMFGLPLFTASDNYRNGAGQMFGKAARLFTLFDARGEKITLGTLTRLLSEMIWFPTAYLGDNITWTAVDDQAADVALTDHGRTASGRMFFDEQGRFVTFEAMRYKEDDGQYTLLPWHTPATEWGERGGLKLPVRGEVYWVMPDGKLTYGDFNIVAVEYNRPGDTV
ncbi:MAG: hypothetical protein KA586_02450 [Candidatus Promineofilum sp.]|nr:hypothetical protein [Promineifilum sp.]